MVCVPNWYTVGIRAVSNVPVLCLIAVCRCGLSWSSEAEPVNRLLAWQAQPCTTAEGKLTWHELANCIGLVRVDWTLQPDLASNERAPLCRRC